MILLEDTFRLGLPTVIEETLKGFGTLWVEKLLGQ